MPTIEESVDIRAPIGVVFAAITDPRRSVEWSPSVIEVTNVMPLPVQVGTTWRQRARMAGTTVNLDCRVVTLQPPCDGTLEISGDQRGTLTTHCREGNGLTRVTQTLGFDVPGGLAGSIMAKVAQPIIRREMAQSLARVRDALEREEGGSGGSWPKG